MEQSPPANGAETGTVLHADLDSFFASVEVRDHGIDPSRPVVVGDGIVLAATYPARAFGIHTTMNMAEARRRCRDLLVMPARMDAYSAASEEVFAVFEDTTPLVEGISIDEAFLEVGGLARTAGTPTAIATRLRERVRDEVGLPVSVGIAGTKFLAKVASAHCKPDGLLALPLDGEIGFLHALPVRALWGVGRVTEAKLHSRGVSTIGELAAIDPAMLTSWVGAASGAHLHDLANNRDPRRVAPTARRSSLGAQQALPRLRRDQGDVETILLALVERVTRRLRDGRRIARTLTLQWRDDEMSSHTISTTLTHPTDVTADLLAELRGLCARMWERIDAPRITLVGVTLSNLTDVTATQLGFDLSTDAEGAHRHADTGATDPRTDPALDRALDEVRRRFGGDAVTRGSLLDYHGTAAPVLPDKDDAP